jgi:uncharacterized membrane protein
LLLNFGEKSVEVKRKIREITKEDRRDKHKERIIIENPVYSVNSLERRVEVKRKIKDITKEN